MQSLAPVACCVWVPPAAQYVWFVFTVMLQKLFTKCADIMSFYACINRLTAASLRWKLACSE